METKATLPLIPKVTPRIEFIPALPDDALSWLAGSLGPPERRAMREIVLQGDLAEVSGQQYLVAPVSPATIDTPASFEAEGEDCELDASDLVDEADHEPDCPEARQRFIAERRAEGRSG